MEASKIFLQRVLSTENAVANVLPFAFKVS
jgi:hypothetical protein